MITKEQEQACSKSKLYFKDPGTNELLTGMEERVAGPEEYSDKFIYPQIKVSTGDIVKLSYALWTKSEKDIYKAYRDRGKSDSKPKQVKDEVNVSVKTDSNTAAADNTYDTSQQPEVGYDADASIGSDSKKVIAECDQLCGIWMYSGLTYAVLSKKGSNKLYHIPRALIDNENMTRLCNGV